MSLLGATAQTTEHLVIKAVYCNFPILKVSGDGSSSARWTRCATLYDNTYLAEGLDPWKDRKFKMADELVRVVEFYSGIGGMHFALRGTLSHKK